MIINDENLEQRKSPLVSIIIPCYRQGRYLLNAIESALAQNYGAIEVIVVNDGSDDDTEVVAKGFGHRIRYLQQENKGLSSARNAGFSASTGAMIQFLDADDVISPTKIDVQVTMLNANRVANVCLSDYRIVDMCKGVDLFRVRPDLGNDPLLSLTSRWETQVLAPIHCALFRREVWGDGLPFNTGLHAREDWVMWCALAVSGCRFCYIDQQLAEYRVYSASMCSDGNRMLKALIDAVYIIRPTLPDVYLEGFDNHVMHLMYRWARRDLLTKAIDYRDSYDECRRELSCIQNTRAWRVVSRLWKSYAFAFGRR